MLNDDKTILRILYALREEIMNTEKFDTEPLNMSISGVSMTGCEINAVIKVNFRPRYLSIKGEV